MKLQQIKSLCTKAREIFIFNARGGRQWLGTGTGVYPVEGIEVTEDNICSIFDLSEKQADKITFRTFDYDDLRFDYNPQPQAESECTRLACSVYMGGDVYAALKGTHGLLFIKQALLKPCERKEGELQFFERIREGHAPLIAVYGDMLVGGLVVPVEENRAVFLQQKAEEVVSCNIRPIPKQYATVQPAGRQVSFQNGQKGGESA